MIEAPKALIEPELYAQRFSERDLASARAMWRPIAGYLQRYVDASGTTLDLGAGFCHFINTIESSVKIAVDINAAQLARYAGPGVRCLSIDGADLAQLPSGSIDTVFASNVYEHFPSRESVAASLAEIRRILKPGGRAIVMQPNFRYCMKRYFDFFDHRLAFTHDGMVEGLEMSGFRIDRVIARFLPYTTKSGLPKHPLLVGWYLRMPALWSIFGAQMLIVAVKPSLSVRPVGSW